MRQVIPFWSQIRFIGGSLAGKATILIPFLGYIIISHKFIYGFFHNNEKISNLVNIQIIYIYLTYVGMCFVGIGSLVFNLRCDPVIKRYENDDVYVNSTHMTTTRFDIMEKLYTINNKLNTDNSKKKQVLLFINSAQSGDYKISSEIINFTLREYYNIKDIDNIYSRFISFLFISIGIIVMAVPMVLTFFSLAGYILFDSVLS